MKLHEAYTLAERIKAELAPRCERIEIAGSIRRARPEVQDIDLVILPKPGELQAIAERCKARSRVVLDGPQNLIVVLPRIGFQLDIFFAHGPEQTLLERRPGNWGTLLLCRTGSKEHNMHLAQRALGMGLKWKPQQGLFGPAGEWLAGEEEEDVFKALGMEVVPPALRER